MTKKKKHEARKPQALNEHEAIKSFPSLEDRRESHKDPPSLEDQVDSRRSSNDGELIRRGEFEVCLVLHQMEDPC